MTTLGPSRRGTKRRTRDNTRAKMVLTVDLNSPVLDVDLNSLPVNGWLGEGTSSTSHPLVHGETTVSVNSQHSHSDGCDQGSSQPTIGESSSSLIDLEAIEDEVQLLSSSTGFPRGRNRSRRNRPITVDLDDDLDTNSRISGVAVERRERNSGNRTYINCDYLDIEDEDGTITKRKNATKPAPEPPKQPKEPTFTCPVCLNTLVEAASTICGHIFCESCIEASIRAQKKCPTCRRKLAINNFHRVYLPTTN